MKTFSKHPAENSFVKINCALCGSEDHRPAWPGAQMPFVRCRNCGLVFQNPQPVQEQLLERYDGEYFEYEIENEANFLNLMRLGLRDVGFLDREAGMLQAAAESGGKPSFLDIGCATGALIGHMRNRGWNVRGVEVCRPAAEYGIRQKKLDIRIGTLETAGFDSGEFDVVHCSHLIEHLTAPRAFLDEVSRILKPGGLFVVVTPDISGFQSVLFRSRWRSAIDDHMYLFSRRTLSGMLEKSGFKPLKSVSWGGLAAGTVPEFIKKIADRAVKPLHAGDVVCIMSMMLSDAIDRI